jgi:hypothetical protein
MVRTLLDYTDIPNEDTAMTISIQVSVNGDYKVPVTIQRGTGLPVTEVISGRGHSGPNVRYIDYYHRDPAGYPVIVTVGAEEQDHGDPAVETA